MSKKSFDINWLDGTKRRVYEGDLLEVQGKHTLVRAIGHIDSVGRIRGVSGLPLGCVVGGADGVCGVRRFAVDADPDVVIELPAANGSVIKVGDATLALVRGECNPAWVCAVGSGSFSHLSFISESTVLKVIEGGEPLKVLFDAKEEA